MAVGTDVISSTAAQRVADPTLFRVQRAVVLCYANSELHQPACFVARFPGATDAVIDVTASGGISETVLTTEAAADQYLDEPAVILEVGAPAGAPKLLLAQEVQSTGDDQFICVAQPGLQAAPGADTHRLSAAEILMRRGVGVHPGTKTLTVTPVTSNILDTQGGTDGTAVDIPGDLNAASAPIKAVVGVFATGRFLSFRLTGDNLNSVFKYLGAILRGQRLA